jgi:hypothetical protein
MKKEKVIIFEGEHEFVAPKSRVRDRKTGVSYNVQDYMNVVSSDMAPIDKPTEDQPPQLDVSQGSGPIRPEPSGGGTTSTTVETTTLRPPTENGKTKLPEADVQLGSPSKKAAIEELAPVTTNLKVDLPISVPTNLGKAPAPIMGGGGGGGSKDQAAAKKTFLQNYWWLIVALGIGGYMYYKKKK